MDSTFRRIVLRKLIYGRTERKIFTPRQAAEYSQVDKETIYRYIRQGKLAASKLERQYRIPKESIDLLLWATRTSDDISLREYTGSEITDFMRSDKLDEEAQAIKEQQLSQT